MPIRWRLTLFNALAIGAILVFLGVLLYALLRNALPSSVEDTVQARALEAARITESGETLSREKIERLTLNGVYVIVRDKQGHTLTETVTLVSQKDDKDRLWRQALDSDKPVGGTANLSPEPPDYVYAVPVKTPGGTVRVVEAGKSYENAQEALNLFGTFMAAGVLAALLLAVGGAYLLARTALSPIEAIVGSARQITEGDLSRRLPVVHSKDEIGQLATTINDLLARLEAAFARQEEALARQRRFVADAGHELRTPLTSIRGYARMLKEWGTNDPETARESATAIDRESERMRELVEELLALARGDEGAPLDLSSHDLGDVASEAVEVARAVGGKLSITYVPPEDEVEAIFDRGRIRQAASILLDNALKYTPEGGAVNVTVRRRDGRAEIEVTDTGIGISREQLPHIFERFHRADPSRTSSGAGLGLAIARQIAEAHGGDVHAVSEPDKGSTFILSIPLHR